eukprot:5671736-Amphidinium_carterae.1
MFWPQLDALGWVSGLLLDVWKLGTFFSESRWLSLGHCSRQVLLCQLTGFLNFLRRLRANNFVAEFDATGSSHFSEPVQQWVVFVSLSPCAPWAQMRCLAECWQTTGWAKQAVSGRCCMLKSTGAWTGSPVSSGSACVLMCMAVRPLCVDLCCEARLHGHTWTRNYS